MTTNESFHPVLILGGIAVGKSTITRELTQRIHEFSKTKLITENFVEAPLENPYFRDFLSNPKDQENTIKMQRYFLYEFQKKYVDALTRAENQMIDTVYLCDTYPPISGSFYATAQTWMNYMSPTDFLSLISQYNKARYQMIPNVVILVKPTDIYSNMKMLYSRGKESNEEFEFYLNNSEYFDFIRVSNNFQFDVMRKDPFYQKTKFIELPHVYDDYKTLNDTAKYIIELCLP